MKRSILLLLAALLGTAMVFGCGPVSGAPTGYVHTFGTALLDGTNRPLALRGVALGTDLLEEPWLMGATGASNGMTTSLGRLASVIGQPATDQFRVDYQAAMVTRADLLTIAADGFNTVRLPFNARYLTEQLPVLDQIVSWASDAGLYVILDMHAATCSQNSTFTADATDGTARLWLDASCRAATVDAWRTVAARYAGSTTVAGYDLLNEPDGLAMTNSALIGLYSQIIAAVRDVDPAHMVMVEGRNFTKDNSPFTGPLDPNLVLTFHEYVRSTSNPAANISEVEAAADRLGGVPIWCGEFGLDTAANITPQLARFNADPRIVGWSYWTWKMAARSDTQDGLNEYQAPANWASVWSWAAGKWGASKPTASQASSATAAELAAIGHASTNAALLAALTG